MVLFLLYLLYCINIRMFSMCFSVFHCLSTVFNLFWMNHPFDSWVTYDVCICLHVFVDLVSSINVIRSFCRVGHSVRGSAVTVFSCLLHAFCSWPQGRLWCAFDHTYLTPTLAQTVLRKTHALVGGSWEPSKAEHAFFDMGSEALDIKDVQRASTMLEIVVWDPCALKKTQLSAAAMPMSHDFGTTVRGSKQAGWTMLEIMGSFFSQSKGILLGVVFDAASSHVLIRRCIHGQFLDIPMTALAEIPFFKDLKYVPLKHSLPRLPIQVCLHDDLPFYGLVGPCCLTET